MFSNSNKKSPSHVGEGRGGVFLFLFALLFSMTAMADDLTLSKCGGDDSHQGFGSSYGTTIQAAEQFSVDDMLPYVGGKINRIRACFYIWPEGQLDKNGNPNNTKVTDLELWIKRNVKDEEKLRSIKMSQPEGEGAVWVEVDLDEPLEIEAGMPIALGYTYVQDNTNPPAYFIVLGGDDAYVWLDSGDGTGFRERDLWHLSIEANVTGVEISKPRAEVTGIAMESLYCGPGKKIKADVTYRNLGPECSNVTLEYTCNGTTKTRKVFKKLGLNESNTQELSLTAPNEITEKVEVSARIIAIDGVAYEGTPVTTSFGVIGEMVPRMVVIEEGTGTWCGWCVRGIVAMDRMKEKYPDTFIGIAVHSGDPMDDGNYSWYMDLPGYPGCNVNRIPSFMGSNVSPEGFEDFYKTVSATQTYMDFALEGSIVDGKVEATTTARFGFSQSDVDLRMVYVIMEDGVTGYTQNNYYAGGGYGTMGGYESKPQAVTDQVFNDVARGIYPNYEGEKCSFASSIVAGETYTNTLSVAIPKEVQDKSKLTLVAMMLDGKTGEIAQAHKVKLVDPDAISIVQGEQVENWYNLNGQAVAAPTQPGLYINNGKKVVVK